MFAVVVCFSGMGPSDEILPGKSTGAFHCPTYEN